MSDLKRHTERFVTGAVVGCAQLTGILGCDIGTEPPSPPDTGSATQAIAEGTEDTGDAMRSVVRVRTGGGCSGTLIAPQLVLIAAHCVEKIQAGCARVTFDQDWDPASSAGYKIRIPPTGSANTDDPNAQLVRIDGIQIHPGFSRTDAASSCCPDGDPTGCNGCMDSVQPSYLHDLAVLHLEEPISISPMKVLRRIGSRYPALGRYPITLSSLIDKKAVIAGTSTTTQHPTGAYRAYATPTITSTAMPSGTTVLTGAACEDPLEYGTSDGARLLLNSDPSGGCALEGDSGGPTFLNWTALGGDAISGLQSTDILVAGVHTFGTSSGTTTCPAGQTTGDAPTWDFTYTLEPREGPTETVASNNGSFIEARMKDFDGDGVFDHEDNCPVAPNPDQANCNAHAELAKDYPLRGDVCDPIPCADAVPREPTKTLVWQQTNGPFITKVWRLISDQIDVRGIGSNFYGNGMGNGALRPYVQIGNVPTKYRYCQPDVSAGVSCGAISIDDGFVDTPEGAPDPSRPYHKARLRENPGSGSGFDSETFPYSSMTGELPRRWLYLEDCALWEANGWIGTTSNCGPGNPTALAGRFWSHAATTKGRFTNQAQSFIGWGGWGPSTSGYRINNDGEASSASDADGSHLANHYVNLEPDPLLANVVSKPLRPAHFLFWKVCEILPAWDGGPRESASLIPLENASFGVMLRDGTAVVADDLLTREAHEQFLERHVWASAAEAARFQGGDGYDAVAFAADGRSLVDVAGMTEELQLGVAYDLDAQVPSSTGPTSEREGFVPVYSRYADLAFVVGGIDATTEQETGEIWMRQVVGDLDWELIDTGSTTLHHVLAATYSFRDHRLWVLDDDGRDRRLLRIEPFLGHVEIIGTWAGNADFAQQWLVLDLDGNVVLASSSAEKYGLARFEVDGLDPIRRPRVIALELALGELLLPPAFDPQGHSIVVDPAGAHEYETRRRTVVPGGAAELDDLGPML